MDKDEVLNVWIPYRVQAIQTMLWAYNQIHDLSHPRLMEVFVDGRKILGGHAAALLNPMVEVGFIHARSLLEFMGLATKKGKLAETERRMPDDIAIEHFSVNGIPLDKVSPKVVAETFEGPTDRGEQALVASFELTNKGLAHLSSGFSDGYTSLDLEIACKGIPVLLENNFYGKLGLRMPEPSRPASTHGELSD